MNRLFPALLLSALFFAPTALGGTIYEAEEEYLLGTNGASYGEECGNINLETNVAGVCFDFGGAGVNRTAEIRVRDDVNDNVLVRIQFGVYTNGVLTVSPSSIIDACRAWTGVVPDWAEGVKVAIYNDGHTNLGAYPGCDAGVSGTVKLELFG